MLISSDSALLGFAVGFSAVFIAWLVSRLFRVLRIMLR